MKSLFEKTKYTDSASEINRLIENAIRPVIKAYSEQGYSLRELELIALHSVTFLVSELALTEQHREAKYGKEK